MSDTAEVLAGTPVEKLTVRVTLTVKHQVTVKIDGDSGQTMNELKDLALAEFHRNVDEYGRRFTGARSDDRWRAQFQNRTNISVGYEDVAIASVETKPAGQSVNW